MERKSKLIRRFLLAVLVLLGIAFVVAVWIVGGRLVAPANRTVGLPPEDFPCESITIESESGSKLAAWYVPDSASTATVILLHPVRSDRRSMLDRARFLAKQGYDVLLIDMQAHGESPGEHITSGHREKLDVAAAVDFVKGRHPDHRIGIDGWSLGGAATLLAVPLGVDAIVLESVYPTISEAVYDRVEIRLGPLKHLVAPALLCQLKPRLGIAPSDLRPIDFVSRVGCPLLVLAGDADVHTPLEETQRMFAEAEEPKRLVVFENAAHEDLMAFDQKLYETEVGGFFEAYLKDGSEPIVVW